MKEQLDKTKNRMAKALKEIMARKPIKKISVEEIVGRCQLSRQTFYVHFIDKYELVNYIWDLEIMEILVRYEADRDFLQMSVQIMEVMKGNRKFYLNALSDLEGQNSFFDHWQHLNKTWMRDQIDDEHDIQELEMAIEMYCFGSMFIIYKWIINGSKGNIQKISQLMVNCMPEVIKPYYM